MTTLLNIYENHLNGNLKDMTRLINEYGPEDFALDVRTEIKDGVLTDKEAVSMLTRYLILNK